jgi:hypothetical protein
VAIGLVLPMATSQTSQTLQKVCLTIYPDTHGYPEWDNLREKVRYLAYAEETCPTTNRLHLQAFAYSHKPLRFSSWKRLFQNVHIEPMYGSFQQNEKYCSKEGKLVEFGERPFQGQRRDLLSMKRKLEEGVQPLKMAEDDEYFGVIAKHHKFAETYFDYLRHKEFKTNRDPPNVHVLIGPTGCGKTSWCDQKFGVGNWDKLPTPAGNTWWWNRQCCRSDTIVIDDVGPSQIPKIETLLQWLDRYSFTVEIKGDTVPVKPKNIVITSNLEIEHWYPSAEKVHIEALMRRITEVIKF